MKALKYGPERILLDHHPPPDLGAGPAVMTYCDNLCILGTSRSEVDDALDTVVTALEARGLVVHEIERASPTAAALWRPMGGASEARKTFEASCHASTGRCSFQEVRAGP